MKHSLTILITAVVLFMTACNNQPKPVEEKPTAPAPVEVKAVFKPYKAMLAQYAVKDYDKWHTVFTATDSLRKAYGITESSVGRGLENDKMVLIFNTASDIQKAKELAISPARKAAMMKAGVVGAGTVTYWEVIFDDTSTIPQKERLMITHHVKDFDAWKKGFDAEGDAARAGFGVIERAMARGIDDPNMVTILFAVTDMDKAKARVASPELKKIMTDAGVDSPPQITWFKWVMN